MPEPRSYHGRPVIKEPTWTWEIPLYFYTGGLAGASAGLSWLCDVRGNEVLARRSWLIGLGAVGVSPALLISDLGKPLRFLNMLRMFKVTSPMSVGSWILSVSGATTAVASLYEWTGFPFPAARAARPLAAVFGLPLTTYTAALITNTAIPAWHEARLEMPFLFASSAAAAAGGAAAMASPTKAAAPARRLAIGGAVCEVALEQMMERRLGELAEPYHEGAAHRAMLASRVAAAAGAVAMALRGGRSRRWALVAGALLNVGALCMRWGIYKAGFQSAADPKYVVAPQRAAIESGRRKGAARAVATVPAPKPALGTPATSPSVTGASD